MMAPKAASTSLQPPTGTRLRSLLTGIRSKTNIAWQPHGPDSFHFWKRMRSSKRMFLILIGFVLRREVQPQTSHG